MNSCELVTFISTIACAIANCSTPEETAILASIFTQLGDTLETITVHNDICNPKKADESQ